VTEDEGPDSCAQWSEKGGVGKTSITTGVAAVAGARGIRVVVIDGDPRATATEELGVEVGDGTLTLNDLLYIPESLDAVPVDPAEAVFDVLCPAGPAWPSTVRVIPAERKLANRESDARPFHGRIRRAVAALSGHVDLVLIDMPPRPGGNLVNALIEASKKSLVPASLTTDGFAGVQHVLHSIRVLEAGGAHAPELVGIVRSQVPRDSERRAIHEHFNSMLIEKYGDYLLDVQVREYSIREEARAASTPITAAPGPAARTLAKAYGTVLDCILAKELTGAARG
jgi:chromosome partitioning protein